MLPSLAPSISSSTHRHISLEPEVSFKLPPKPYAFHLLSVLEEGFSDYHWYLRSRFHSRLNLTYLDPASQSSDRNWLCRVSVVMALAETWNHGRMSTGESQCRALTDPPSPPGSEFFEQGLLLLNTAPEEIVVEHVEACNLIVSCIITVLKHSNIVPCFDGDAD